MYFLHALCLCRTVFKYYNWCTLCFIYGPYFKPKQVACLTVIFKCLESAFGWHSEQYCGKKTMACSHCGDQSLMQSFFSVANLSYCLQEKPDLDFDFSVLLPASVCTLHILRVPVSFPVVSAVFDVLLTTHSFKPKCYLFPLKLGTSAKMLFVYTALFKYLEALSKWILGGPSIL